MRKLTVNDMTAIIINIIVLAVTLSVIASINYGYKVSLAIIMFILVVVTYLIYKFQIFIKNDCLPGYSYEMKSFYEFHIGTDLSANNYAEIIDVLIETLEYIKNYKKKDIVFEVSSHIIKPARVKTLFGDNCTCFKKITLLIKIYNYKMIALTWLINRFSKKTYRQAKRKNMYRYVIDCNTFDIDYTINKMQNMKKKLIKYNKRHA